MMLGGGKIFKLGRTESELAEEENKEWGREGGHSDSPMVNTHGNAYLRL